MDTTCRRGKLHQLQNGVKPVQRGAVDHRHGLQAGNRGSLQTVRTSHGRRAARGLISQLARNSRLSEASTATANAQSEVQAQPSPRLPLKEWTSEMFYQDAYAHHGMHAKLLKDSACIKKFRDVVLHNKHLFQGKVVLDIGCGLGILAMFAARAGAARVIGIDCSAILDHTEEVVRANKLDDVITLVRGRVEEVNLPEDVMAVDIILCNWMGYSLFHRSMIGAVIHARRRWLKPSGLIFPDRASLFVCGFEDKAVRREEISWWANVHSFNMLALREAAQEEPFITFLHPDRVVTDVCLLKTLDLYTADPQDLVFSAEFQLEGKKDCSLHGLATFFVAEFSKCHKAKELWTAPQSAATHWKQTLFSFGTMDIPFLVGHKVSGVFSVHNVTTSALGPRQPLQVSIKLDLENEVREIHEVMKYKLR